MTGIPDLARRVDRLEALFLDLDPVVPGVVGWSPRLRAIIDDAARLAGINASNIVGVSRTKAIVRARFAAIWAMREATGESYARIGRSLGKRDHTSIAHGFREAGRLRESNSDFHSLTEILTERATERARSSVAEPDLAEVPTEQLLVELARRETAQ